MRTTCGFGFLYIFSHSCRRFPPGCAVSNAQCDIKASCCPASIRVFHISQFDRRSGPIAVDVERGEPGIYRRWPRDRYVTNRGNRRCGNRFGQFRIDRAKSRRQCGCPDHHAPGRRDKASVGAPDDHPVGIKGFMLNPHKKRICKSSHNLQIPYGTGDRIRTNDTPGMNRIL